MTTNRMKALYQSERCERLWKIQNLMDAGYSRSQACRATGTTEYEAKRLQELSGGKWEKDEPDRTAETRKNERQYALNQLNQFAERLDEDSPYYDEQRQDGAKWALERGLTNRDVLEVLGCVPRDEAARYNRNAMHESEVDDE